MTLRLLLRFLAPVAGILLVGDLRADGQIAVAGELRILPGFLKWESSRMPFGKESSANDDAKAGLRFERLDYLDLNASEWKVKIQAPLRPEDGRSDIYDGLQSADFILHFPQVENSNQSLTLHWSSGSQAESSDFQPHAEPLFQGRKTVKRSLGGRSSDGVMPYFNGLYNFLDELVRRKPGLIIDNCASGGRRLDFEMMRRSVVLWRSDSCWEGEHGFPRNIQCMTHGLSLWLPLHGLGAHFTDEISLRSGMGACSTFPINYRDPAAVGSLRRHLERYMKIRHLFATDYYPISAWSSDPGRWLAFQFHEPSSGEGVIQAFVETRGTPAPPTRLRLQGLNPVKTYAVSDWDHPEAPPQQITGLSLMNEGLEVVYTGAHGPLALVFTYVEKR